MTAAAGPPDRTPIIVAIDGPAGAGKSTVARRLAAALRLPFVDTGAMYRAAALYLKERGIDPEDRAAVAAAAAELPLELAPDEHGASVLLGGVPVEPRIRTPEIAELSSRVARHPELRARMVALQREFVRRHGGVMEGRDIGTVVVPETPFKFFLDAEPRTRAERRHAELAAQGVESDLERIERHIVDRDERDATRASSPLAVAEDSVHVASDGLSVDQVVARILTEIDRRLG